jgi:DNA-binding transcriptional LysR family regulator
MKPTLNQLINFCTVAETGNIGKAASKLNISQPLKPANAQLETILGAKLFNRAAKGVSLTLAESNFWWTAGGAGNAGAGL